MSATSLRFPGWSGLLWASLAALLLTAAGVVAVAASQAAAAPDDPAPWWHCRKPTRASAGAPGIRRQHHHPDPRNPAAAEHTHDRVALGVPGRLSTVSFLETHVTRDAQGTLTWGGQRVNLAVVTQEHADDVTVVNNPAFNPNSANDDYRSRREQLLAAVRRDVPAGLN